MLCQTEHDGVALVQRGCGSSFSFEASPSKGILRKAAAQSRPSQKLGIAASIRDRGHVDLDLGYGNITQSIISPASQRQTIVMIARRKGRMWAPCCG